MNINKTTFLFGVILIAIGGILLLKSFDIFYLKWDTIGSVILIFFGAYQLGAWALNRKNYGLLFPGTIMLIYGLVFLLCSWNSWNLLSDLWPVFILAPGVAFLLMYFFGNKETGLLVTAIIMLGIGFIFLSQNFFYYNFWPVIIIVIGILLIWKGKKDRIKAEK